MTTTGTIVEAASGCRQRGVYERRCVRFVYTLDANHEFCFCPGRTSPDIDEAWASGYAEELRRGTYQL